MKEEKRNFYRHRVSRLLRARASQRKAHNSNHISVLVGPLLTNKAKRDRERARETSVVVVPSPLTLRNAGSSSNLSLTVLIGFARRLDDDVLLLPSSSRQSLRIPKLCASAAAALEVSNAGIASTTRSFSLSTAGRGRSRRRRVFVPRSK